MKQLFTLSILLSLLLPFCTTSKKATIDSKKTAPMLSYAKDVAPILAERCSPCHFPNGGKRKFLDTHEAVASQIDDVLRRIQLPQDTAGFMPFKMKKEPLSDSLIHVIQLWKDQKMPL